MAPLWEVMRNPLRNPAKIPTFVTNLGFIKSFRISCTAIAS